ncbi:MAG: hypothetical protein U0T82_13800 [Bacteroidales bacterium]
MARVLILMVLGTILSNRIFSQGSLTKNNPRLIPFCSFDVDRLEVNFDDFGTNIDSINLVYLDRLDNNLNMTVGLSKKRFYTRMNFGSVGSAEKYLDSINIKFRNYQLGLEFGYFLLDYKGYIIKPCFSMNYCCYRIVNYPTDKVISFNEYYRFNPVDLRINQFVGIFKVRLELNPTNDVTIGGYCGYAFKINDKAIVHSKRNSIRNNHQVQLNSITYGISTTVYIQ